MVSPKISVHSVAVDLCLSFSLDGWLHLIACLYCAAAARKLNPVSAGEPEFCPWKTSLLCGAKEAEWWKLEFCTKLCVLDVHICTSCPPPSPHLFGQFSWGCAPPPPPSYLIMLLLFVIYESKEKEVNWVTYSMGLKCFHECIWVHWK